MYAQVIENRTSFESKNLCFYVQVSLIVWAFERHRRWFQFQTTYEEMIWTFIADECFPLIQQEVSSVDICQAQVYCLALRIENLRPKDCLKIQELKGQTEIGNQMTRLNGREALRTQYLQKADSIIVELKKDTTSMIEKKEEFCLAIDNIVACLRVCGETLLSYCPCFVDHVIEHIWHRFQNSKFKWSKGPMVKALVCFTHLIMGLDLYFSGQEPLVLPTRYYSYCISICKSVLSVSKPKNFLHQDFAIETGISILILGGFHNLSETQSGYVVGLASVAHTSRRSWAYKLHFLSLSRCFLMLHFREMKVSIHTTNMK